MKASAVEMEDECHRPLRPSDCLGSTVVSAASPPAWLAALANYVFNLERESERARQVHLIGHVPMVFCMFPAHIYHFIRMLGLQR